jgi:rubrerythrin/uncharacterized membrane protein
VGPEKFDETQPDPEEEAPKLLESRRWRCTVCGYIHTGIEPPETCPVCHAGREKFKEAGDDEPQPVKAERAAADRAGHDDPTAEYKAIGPRPSLEEPDEQPDPAAPPRVESTTAPEPRTVLGKRWRCTVCNYLHEGPEPPEKCPVCGAGAKDFVVDEETADHSHEGLGGLIEKLHAHPVTAHFPNGSLPLALAFWVAYLVLGDESLERTSFYLMLISTAVAPVTFFTGWSDANHRFGGADTGIFPEKKRWGWILIALVTGMAVWRLAAGWSAVPDTTITIIAYTASLTAANALAVRLGLLGGKLIFGH